MAYAPSGIYTGAPFPSPLQPFSQPQRPLVQEIDPTVEMGGPCI